MSYYELEPSLKSHIQKEREKARRLKKTSWWNALLQKGTCYYCHQIFSRNALTLDHVVPLARGGTSNKANIVPSCRTCNQTKKLDTPVDLMLKT